jgi:hypothetical protein
MTPSGTSGRQHGAAGRGEEEAGGAVGDAAAAFNLGSGKRTRGQFGARRVVEFKA